MKNIKKISKRKKITYVVSSFVLALIIGSALFLIGTNQNFHGDKSLSGLTGFGKYSGTNDSRDGIVLSACGSAAISATSTSPYPAQSNTFSHNYSIIFSGTINPWDSVTVTKDCWNPSSDPTKICKSGDVSNTTTFTTPANTFLPVAGTSPSNFFSGLMDDNDTGAKDELADPARMGVHSGNDLTLSVAGSGTVGYVTVKYKKAGVSTYVTPPLLFPPLTKYTFRADVHSMSLTANDTSGSVFDHWEGDIDGSTCASAPSNSVCSNVIMSKDRTIKAVFAISSTCSLNDCVLNTCQQGSGICTNSDHGPGCCWNGCQWQVGAKDCTWKEVAP